jgi:hypothetical protein
MKRFLTPAEIILLAEEYEELDRWRQVLHIVRQICGSNAAQVTVGIVYLSDDGENVEKQIRNIYIVDEDNRCLWTPYSYKNVNGQMINEFSAEEQFTRQEQMKLFPMWDATYGLDEPPPLSFPRAYVNDETGERVATSKEVQALSQQYKKAFDWEHVRDTVRDAFGEEACEAVVLPPCYHYNDESYYPIGHYLEAYNREGMELLPDLHLPLWQQQEYQEIFAFIDEDGDWLAMAKQGVMCTLYDAGGAAEGRYVLNEPPQVDPPPLYILD